MSRKVCNIACEDKCLIADEETTELATEYKNYKTISNLEIRLIFLKVLTNLFPEVSVFSDIKHSDADS